MFKNFAIMEKLMPLEWNAEEIDQFLCPLPTEKERLANGYLWPGKLLGVIGEVTGSLVMWFFWENPWW